MVVGLDDRPWGLRTFAGLDDRCRGRKENTDRAAAGLAGRRGQLAVQDRIIFRTDRGSASSRMTIKSVHLTNYYHKDSGGISTAYNKLLEGANRHRRYVRLVVPGEESRTEEIGEFGRIYYVKAGFSPV